VNDAIERLDQLAIEANEAFMLRDDTITGIAKPK
jgi:hypothetical protein